MIKNKMDSMWEIPEVAVCPKKLKKISCKIKILVLLWIKNLNMWVIISIALIIKFLLKSTKIIVVLMEEYFFL